VTNHHSLFLFKVHDEEERWLAGGLQKISLLQETPVLVQVGVLAHRI
jgi:hypothetical protein